MAKLTVMLKLENILLQKNRVRLNIFSNLLDNKINMDTSSYFDDQD